MRGTQKELTIASTELSALLNDFQVIEVSIDQDLLGYVIGTKALHSKAWKI